MHEIFALIRRVPLAASGSTTSEDLGAGHAVLVLPTWLRGDRQTRGLRAALDAHGFRAFGWSLGVNFGPTARLRARAGQRLRDLAAQHGRVSVVGLSMGGLFARSLALHHPALVRQVVTVCSPFREPLDSFCLPLRPLLRLWPRPEIEALAAEVGRPLPIPSAALYSRCDGIVAWASCRDPREQGGNCEIASPHVAIAHSPEVRAVVLRILADGPLADGVCPLL